jgi:K+-sensing histidine kinase KdpD
VTPPRDGAAVRAGAAPAPAPAREDRPPALRVVPRRQRRGWQVGTVAGALLFAALFAVAGFQALIATHQKHLDEVTDRIAEEEARATALEDDLAELESPQRIIGEATQRLGMMTAAPPVYLHPQDDDDARAAEVPAPTPPTTAAPTTTVPPTTATTTATTAPKSTATTAAKATSASSTPSSSAGAAR